MKDVILICPEPIRRLQQGIGIRFLEMANELARVCRVSLWVPNDDFPKEFPYSISKIPDDNFAAYITQTDAVVVHGHISEWYFDSLARHGLGSGPPLVVDLYDPFLIENLQYTSQLGESVYYRDRAVLFRQLALGDFFLASSDSQRLFYIGMLAGMGRLSPVLYHQDNTLRSFIDVVPFGIRAIDTATAGGRLKGVVPGIGQDDLVLFFGGIYDWYDPGLLLDVLALVIERIPEIRVVFSLNPSPETTPQGTFAQIRQRAKTNGWEDRTVFFIPWFPYAERAAYFRDVDLALSLHKPSLETDLSLRTRILEYLNFGIPAIATEGGESGRILAAAGGGVLVPAGDREALSETLLELLKNGKRRAELARQGQSWIRAHMTWERILAPLIRFCESPQKLPGNALAPMPIHRHTLSRLYHYWRSHDSRHFVQTVLRRLFGYS